MIDEFAHRRNQLKTIAEMEANILRLQKFALHIGQRIIRLESAMRALLDEDGGAEHARGIMSDDIDEQ